ncbi:MAG: hypothetical protein RJA81_2129, partial [Planctomycetota bacterium]
NHQMDLNRISGQVVTSQAWENRRKHPTLFAAKVKKRMDHGFKKLCQFFRLR